MSEAVAVDLLEDISGGLLEDVDLEITGGRFRYHVTKSGRPKTVTELDMKNLSAGDDAKNMWGVGGEEFEGGQFTGNLLLVPGDESGREAQGSDGGPILIRKKPGLKIYNKSDWGFFLDKLKLHGVTGDKLNGPSNDIRSFIGLQFHGVVDYPKPLTEADKAAGKTPWPVLVPSHIIKWPNEAAPTAAATAPAATSKPTAPAAAPTDGATNPAELIAGFVDNAGGSISDADIQQAVMTSDKLPTMDEKTKVFPLLRDATFLSSVGLKRENGIVSRI